MIHDFESPTEAIMIMQMEGHPVGEFVQDNGLVRIEREESNMMKLTLYRRKVVIDEKRAADYLTFRHMVKEFMDECYYYA